MKEELQDKLVEILAAIQTTAGQAKDFTLAQLPDIAQSYVMYGRVKSAVLVTLLLLIAAGLLALAVHAYKNPWNISEYSWDRDKKRSESNWMAMWLGGGLGIFMIFAAFTTFNWLVWFAPKVWLLKEIANLLK